MMKAWVLEKQASIEERPLKLVQIPAPRCGDNEVRLRVLACGVCRTDIHIAEGDLPLRVSPVTLGHEIVGIVDEVGKKVERFCVGDKAGLYWLHSACGRCKHCLSQRENYCTEIKCTGWDVDGGYAEYVTAPAKYTLPLNGVRMSPTEIAPLMCPGIAGYAAFKLAGTSRGDKLGLYGFGPTAYYVLKVAHYLGVEVYVSTRSPRNIESARKNGARWAANAAEEEMPCKLDGAILFPPEGKLVEPVLGQLRRGSVLVMAPVSASPIRINNYSENLWGRDIKTLYNLSHSDAEAFFKIVEQMELEIGISLFSFEDLADALIQVKEGKLEQANAVIKVSD